MTVADVGLAVTVKPAALMVSDTARDVLPASSASPPYTAVIECEPTVSEVVVNVAVPEPFSVPVPSVVVPSLKVTVPVGVPETRPFTTAVNVTDPPENAGFVLDVSAVVVFCCTTCVNTAEVLARLLASPPYTAVMECEPTAKAAVENVATPEPLRAPVPRVVPPSLNVAVPVGVPEPVTVAVNVTEAPARDGFTLEVNVVVEDCSIDSVKTAEVLAELFASPP